MKTESKITKFLIGFLVVWFIIAITSLISLFFINFFAKLIPILLLILCTVVIVYSLPIFLYLLYKKRDPLIGRGILVGIIFSPIIIALVIFSWFIYAMSQFFHSYRW